MIYVVKFKYRDLLDEVQHCSVEFDNYDEAEKFRKHITDMTNYLIQKYGIFGIYNPYRDIKLIAKEEKHDIE